MGVAGWGGQRQQGASTAKVTVDDRGPGKEGRGEKGMKALPGLWSRVSVFGFGPKCRPPGWMDQPNPTPASR